MSLLEYIAGTMIVVGLIFFFGAALGVLRFPDFYTRMHAAGKGDTLSTLLILGGLGLVAMQDFTVANILVGLKIFAIIFFILLTSPTSTHALMNAGYAAGLRPWKKPRSKNRKP